MWFTWLCTDICMGHWTADLAGQLLVDWFQVLKSLGWCHEIITTGYGGQVAQEGISGFLIASYLNVDLKNKSFTHITIFFWSTWTRENKNVCIILNCILGGIYVIRMCSGLKWLKMVALVLMVCSHGGVILSVSPKVMYSVFVKWKSNTLL
jgi:hypothetical protein